MKKQLTNENPPRSASKTTAANISRQVPFTEEHMLTLLKAYEAYSRLRNLAKEFAGSTADFSFGNSIMGDLSYLEKLIADLSPLYDPQEDYEKSQFYNLLDNPDIPAEIKAAELLCSRQ